MARIINPLLVESTSTTSTSSVTTVHRNFARLGSDEIETSFANQLAEVQAVKPPVVTVPISASASTVRTASPTSTVSTTAPTSSAAVEEAETEDGTDDIKPATSWRVNRNASEVHAEVDDFSFDDFIDIINPLQHIPVVGMIYREVTGDTIKPVSRVVGDIAFGAVTGSFLTSGIASIASAIIEQETGEDPAVQVADALFGRDKPEADQTIMVAEADTTTAEDAAAPVAETKTIQMASAQTSTTASAAKVDFPAHGKQAYGGVMASASAAQQAAANLAMTSSPRMGNTIFTNTRLNTAARLASTPTPERSAMQVAASSSTATAVPAASSTLPSSLSPSALMSVPGSTTEADSKKLGQVMHQAAAARTSGQTLPPNLVQDMMLMALDKYKTASGLASSEMTIN